MRNLAIAIALAFGLFASSTVDAQQPVRDFLRNNFTCNGNSCFSQPSAVSSTPVSFNTRCRSVVYVPVTRTRCVRVCTPCGVRYVQRTFTTYRRVVVRSRSSCTTSCCPVATSSCCGNGSSLSPVPSSTSVGLQVRESDGSTRSLSAPSVVAPTPSEN